ncbi:hypothetical protein ON010_g1743 [Phytophthora cinnamomi]|nr:hypothetical protein ON010_g1743 [Phytophthora cinnamomi]
MLKFLQDRPTEVVQLSYWVFTVWWTLILSVHVIAGVYAALYAYCYLKLKDTFLNVYFEPFQIGMPPPYHRTIATVHVTMAAVHAICIFLMLGGSLWQRSLAFTPWSSCNAAEKQEEEKHSRRNSAVLRSFSKVYTTVPDRHGICGVNSDHFHVVLIIRETIETALQTTQAYRMMGVGLLVLLNYAKDYDHSLDGFDDSLWHNDEWAARAINEFRVVVVTSLWDLVSRAIFSFGLVMTASSIKTLLQRLPREGQPIETPRVHTIQEAFHGKLNTVVPQLPPVSAALGSQFSKSTLRVKLSGSIHATNLRTRTGQVLLTFAHILFGTWGLVVLSLHIHASIQPALPQCLMQVRPWGATRPSCYSVGLDCYTLAISGKTDEVEEKWSEFDSSTVVQLLIRHCPALEMPDSSKLHGVRGIKVYNSTIVEWGESAAITNSNHPGVVSLYLARVNMTDGVLPMGFQSSDFPQNLNDFELCVTNLWFIPDDLDTKWAQRADLQIEYSHLVSAPSVLLRLEPMYFALTGNPMTEIPPKVFETPGLETRGLGGMNLDELPRNVTNLSPTLRSVFLDGTNISFFWPWADEFITRSEKWEILVVTGTPYCANLEQIQIGAASFFSVPSSPEYASILMDPSEVNQPPALGIVRCEGFDGPYYFINLDDENMAISPPTASTGSKTLKTTMSHQYTSLQLL